MTSSLRTVGKGAAIALGSLLVLIVGTVAGVAIFSRQLTEYALEKALAREATIAGDFDVEWGRIVRVHAEDVSVGNVEWATEPAFFKARVLDLAIDLPALIGGKVILPLVHLAGFELNLARSAEGKVNWEFGDKGQNPPQAAPIIPDIAELTFGDGRVFFRDLELGTEVTAVLASLQGRITPSAVELYGLGEFEGNPLTFDVAASGTDALDGPAPYEIELELATGTTVARIVGTLSRPLNLTGLDVALTLEGGSLHELATLAGLSLPETTSYRLEGTLQQHEKAWRLIDFGGHLGDSDLHGDLTLDFSGPRPILAADLVSNQLDSDLLLALIDAVPKDDSEVLQTPQAPTGLSRLRAVDARVQLVVHDILSTEWPIDEVSVQLTLEDGLLVVDPIKIGLVEGALTGEIRLNAAGGQPSGNIALAFDRVALAPIAALVKPGYPISGIVDGELALAFAGGRIGIADGQVDYRAPERDTDLALALARVEAVPVDLLKLSVQGTFRGEDAKATFVGAPLTLLFAADAADKGYPVRFDVHIAQTDAAASGTMTAFGSTFDLEMSASGPGTARLSELLGIELPQLPAYVVSGQIVRGENHLEATSLQASMGASDVVGSVRVDMQGPEAYIEADLRSQTLAYADFEQWRDKEKGAKPLDLTRLEEFNADVRFTAKRVIAPDEVVFSDVVVDGQVADGRLTLKPLKFGVAGGQVLAELVVGQANDRLVGHVDANIDTVDLGIALQPIGLAERFGGILDAELDLAFDSRDNANGEGVLRYREAEAETDAKLVIDQTAESLEVEGSGRFHGESFQLSASLGELSKLVSNDRFPVDIEITAVETQASIQGTVGNPLQLRDLELTLNLSGPTPERLYPILRLNLPNLPPYEIEGALAREGDIWKFEAIKGSVGDSVISGEIVVDSGGDKPFLRAQLESLHLDFDDLGPLIGKLPDARETASPQQIADAGQLAMRERTLPDEPFNFDRFDAMNADVRFHARTVTSDVAPLDDVTIHLTLTNGRMTLNPIEFGVAGGKLRLTAALDARPEPAEGTVEVEITSIDLAKLLQPFDIAKGTRGVIEGQGSLSFQGTTFAQMLGDLDGDAKLLMDEGQLNALLVELAGIDGGESLLTWLDEGVQLVPLRCAFADLAARDGIVHVERFVIDSADTRFNMDGEVDLKEETFDFTIKAHPKDASFFVARAPLVLEGTFKNPEFRVAKRGLVARGLAAIALGIIAPPAALLALFEPGLGDNAPCNQLVQTFAAGSGHNASNP